MSKKAAEHHRKLPNTIRTLPDTTKKRRSTTTVGIMRKRHIMLTPEVVTPSMPEITLKKRERLIQKNTARSNIPLLTSPRMTYPCGIPLNDPTCLIALPITPNRVFFASAARRTRDKMRGMSLAKIASIVNEEAIWRSTSVFFANKSLSGFVTPKVAGKATGTWQPRKK